MESIYYVLCWHCHRRCKHCYEERFRPYVRDELESVVAEAKRNAPSIVANLPERMTYLELDPQDPQRFLEKTGKITLSGGDVLTEPVRESVLYPTLEAIHDKYRDNGGIRVVVQTTGDLLTPAIIEELLARGVWNISVSGLDDYHVGMEGEKKQAFAKRVPAMLLDAGLQDSTALDTRSERGNLEGPLFSMFGATEDTWIGKLWPRGRAWQNNFSQATLADNFCDAWSGGLNFLNHQYAGSEVPCQGLTVKPFPEIRRGTGNVNAVSGPDQVITRFRRAVRCIQVGIRKLQGAVCLLPGGHGHSCPSA
ncbi:MAG: radical SAM protein [Pseudomonadales bacterium]|nr:radical SAM protein [Pseudomonadales bacterium]